MTLVVDASVVLKWYVAESDSAVARALFDAEPVLIAPDLVVAEVCNAAWRLLRGGELDELQYHRIAREVADFFEELMPLAPLAPRAAAAAVALDHPLYDCFYLALSEARDLPLVTADRRFARRSRATAFASRIQLLSEYRHA